MVWFKHLWTGFRFGNTFEKEAEKFLKTDFMVKKQCMILLCCIGKKKKKNKTKQTQI